MKKILLYKIDLSLLNKLDKAHLVLYSKVNIIND
jgi:hypothetical protein